MNIRSELAAIKRRLAWAIGVRKHQQPYELVCVVVDDRQQLEQLEKTYPRGRLSELPAALFGLVSGEPGMHRSIPANVLIEHAAQNP
jgi:hypothetical protein